MNKLDDAKERLRQNPDTELQSKIGKLWLFSSFYLKLACFKYLARITTMHIIHSLEKFTMVFTTWTFVCLIVSAHECFIWGTGQPDSLGQFKK